MSFSRRERAFLLGVGALCCLLGAFAGFASLTDELHLESCGGVLDEDAPAVMWHNTWTTGLAFAEIALIAFVVLGFVPIGVRRLVSKWVAR
jgi:hypothetical protein